MNDKQNSFRIQCINGYVVDVSTPNDLVSLWKVIKADGCFMAFAPGGKLMQIIPLTAIMLISPQPQEMMTAALASAPPGGNA